MGRRCAIYSAGPSTVRRLQWVQVGPIPTPGKLQLTGARRQKASTSPGAGRRPFSPGTFENTLEALCLNLPLPSYSIFDFPSPPDSFSSLGLAFLQAGFSHGLMEHYLPNPCSFNTARICRIGSPERTGSDAKAREKDGTSQPTFAFDTENP